MFSSAESIRKVLEDKGIDKLYGYSRKSRDDEENEGLKKHRDRLEAFAKDLGFPIVIVEEVESSETLNRPQMNLLREDIKKKKVRAVVVERLDRLSRKITDLERLLAEWNFHDVVLIEAHRGKIINFEETQSIKVEAVINDLYQDSVKKVLYAGRLKSAELYGHFVNGKPPIGYNYDKDSKKLVPNDKADLVQQIFNWYVEGYSTRAIAIKLNQQGEVSRDGGSFSPNSINCILKNETYIGTVSFGKKQWHRDGEGNLMSKERPEPLVTYENAHPPIIEKELFDKVQDLLQSNRVSPTSKKRNHMYPVSGLVKCAKCNHSMTLIQRTYKDNTRHMVRTCEFVDFTTGKRCSNKGTSADSVEAFLKADLWKNVRPLVMQYKKQIAKGSKLSNKTNKQIEMAELQKKVRELEKQIDVLIDMQLTMGKNERLMVKMTKLNAQLDTVNAQLQRLNDSGDTDDSMAWVERFLDDAEDLVGFPLNYNGKSNLEKNVFWKKYFTAVKLSDGEIVGAEYSMEVQSLMNHKEQVQKQD